MSFFTQLYLFIFLCNWLLLIYHFIKSKENDRALQGFRNIMAPINKFPRLFIFVMCRFMLCPLFVQRFEVGKIFMFLKEAYAHQALQKNIKYSKTAILWNDITI